MHGLPFSSPVHESEVAQSCLTLSDPMDCSLPGSSVHGIFQARVLEWGAIAFSDMYVCMCVCIYIYICVCITHVCICVHVYVCVCGYIIPHSSSSGNMWEVWWHCSGLLAPLTYTTVMFALTRINHITIYCQDQALIPGLKLNEGFSTRAPKICK